MNIKTFQEANEYLDSLIKPVVFARITPEDAALKDPLDRMRELLKLLGNPQQRFKSVLVGGTSGKGSTAYLISHILATAGYKTGFTLSPHLERINERIQINNKAVSNEEFVDLLNSVIPAIKAMKTMPVGEPSHFEVLIAMAFLYFAQENVDIVVVEVGLGGRYDATNTLCPMISVITNISLDHTNILGNTIEKIAKEKAGIIKNIPSRLMVISGAKQSSVVRIIEQKCKETGAKLFRLGKDFNYKIHREGIDGSEFTFWDKGYRSQKLFLSMKGGYQIENACLALEIVFCLVQFGFQISDQDIIEAFKTAFFPGRFEHLKLEIGNLKFDTVLDGAHNPAKMKAFTSSVGTIFKGRKKVFILGFKKEKDIKSMLSFILPLADGIILTQFSSPTYVTNQRALTPQEIAHIIYSFSPKSSIPVVQAQNPKDALLSGQQLIKDNKGIIIVTGSLYLVGEMRAIIFKQKA